MIVRFAKRFRLVALGMMLMVVQAGGQIYPPSQPNRGFYPNGSFSASEFDTINNVTGNVVAKVPLASLPAGRGGSKFSINLTYNSTVFDVRTNVPTPTTAYQILEPSPYGGWQLGFQFGLDFETRSGGGIDCQSPITSNYRIYKMKLRTPDGGVRTLKLQPLSDTTGDGFYSVSPNNKQRVCAGQTNQDPVPAGDLIYVTTDGSFIRVEVSFQTLLLGCTIATNSDDYWQCRAWYAYFPDGSEVRGFGKRTASYLDKNGNQFFFSQYTSGGGNVVELIEDSVGRTIEIEKFQAPRIDEVRMTGANNELLLWKIYYKDVNLVPNLVFICSDTVT